MLDGVYQLGYACAWMKERVGCPACYNRTNGGFVRLLGEDHAKSVEAIFQLVVQTVKDDDEHIVELRALWKRVKVLLRDEAVTYDAETQLGGALRRRGHSEGAKELWLAALEGYRRVLGEEHKDTLDSLNKMGVVLRKMEDDEGALDYYQQALRGKEEVLRKTHPDTLITITNMAGVYMQDLKDFTKADEMYRRALDGYKN